MITIEPVGYIESPLVRREDAPKQGEEGAPVATLVIDPKYKTAAGSIAVGDRLIVLTWLDRANRDIQTVHPRGDLALLLHGVFSTRSPDRPNPVGLHRVTVIRSDGALRFDVEGLEALHMTPIVDVKPELKGMPEA